MSKTHRTTSSDTATAPDWQALLENAVRTPGLIHSAYSAFHNYSTGNQMIAAFECMFRGIEPGPLATFKRWIEQGRCVRKGEKAIALYMPITMKWKKTNDDGEEVESTFTKFILRNNWFTLSQTDGDPIAPQEVPEWSKTRALEALEITEVPFDHMNGNVLGFSRHEGREISVSPLSPLPNKTLFHELGHTLLHSEDNLDGADVPHSLKEVEAESVALICCESLGLDGAEYARGYIQHWLGEGNFIPDTNARRIFGAADKILKAGKEA